MTIESQAAICYIQAADGYISYLDTGEELRGFDLQFAADPLVNLERAIALLLAKRDSLRRNHVTR